MKIRDVLRDEIIGEEIEITDADNCSLKGKKGKVVDETKHTFTLDSGERILKNQVVFKMRDITVKGNKMCFRPHERVKRLR
ncbi:MAG: ribonuclease P protein subunit [Nanobdellota archaeon]